MDGLVIAEAVKSPAKRRVRDHVKRNKVHHLTILHPPLPNKDVN
jgi:hypothetical protein